MGRIERKHTALSNKTSSSESQCQSQTLTYDFVIFTCSMAGGAAIHFTKQT